MGSRPQHPARRVTQSPTGTHRNQRNRRGPAYNSDPEGNEIRNRQRRQTPRNPARGRGPEKAMSCRTRNNFSRLSGGANILVCPDLSVFFASLAFALLVLFSPAASAGIVVDRPPRAEPTPE